MKKSRLTWALSAALLAPCLQAHGQRLGLDRPGAFHSPDRRYELTSLVFELRGVKEVSGSRVGWGGRAGAFFLLSEEFLRYGTEDDFKQMLDDRNPVVRVMGLVCLAQLDAGDRAALIGSRVGDGGEVRLFVGCVTTRATVGGIASRLLSDPNFLGHRSKPSAA